jgi:hypothetical protein
VADATPVCWAIVARGINSFGEVPELFCTAPYDFSFILTKRGALKDGALEFFVDRYQLPDVHRYIFEDIHVACLIRRI